MSDLVFFTESGRDPVRLSDRRTGRVFFNTRAEGSPEGAEVARFSVVYATEERFIYRYGRWTEKKGFEIRWMRARLDLSPGKVAAAVDTLAGVPLAWSHDIGGWALFGSPAAAIGRVRSMGVRGGELVGEVLVSGRELEKHLAGGVSDLEAGMNAGISIGFQTLTDPKITRADGTRDKPDRLVYGQIRVIEASLTPVPQLKSAGVRSRLAWPLSSDGRRQHDPAALAG